ncbi:MAG: HEAT repeat domain-containing protein [Dehalococcoidia bacterium]|nr:HEAT repeat domain-containing protein [Dehalococcoidia bacterium]
MTLERIMADLSDPDANIRHTDLVQLSGLSRGEVMNVISDWTNIGPERRRELLDRMSELAGDDIELDFTALFRACLRDGEASVRASAARGLWDSDDRIVIRPLVELLSKDPSPEVRSAAATTLGKFAEMSEDGKLIRRDSQRISNALMAVIENPNEDNGTRRRAIEAIAPINSERVHETIQRSYDDDDPLMKQSAIYAMGRSSDSRWLSTVLHETAHRDAAIRYEAAIACGFLGDNETVPRLINMLNDEDTQVQLAAARSLGNIGGDLAKRALTQAMKRGDHAMEEAAEQALASIEFEEDPLGFRFDD